MNIEFSEDVVSLTDLKTNPGRMVKHMAAQARVGARRHFSGFFPCAE